MTEQKTIYELELHESLIIYTTDQSPSARKNQDRYTVTKVHNGWLYHIWSQYGTSVTFVPQYQTEPQL
jgi:hypothetical protein